MNGHDEIEFIIKTLFQSTSWITVLGAGEGVLRSPVKRLSLDEPPQAATEIATQKSVVVAWSKQERLYFHKGFCCSDKFVCYFIEL